MPSTKNKFPCNTTRCFLPHIHPKNYFIDFGTCRLQIKKHPKVRWKDISIILKQSTWDDLFKAQEKTSIIGHTLVSSWRLRLGSKELGLAPNGYWYRINGKSAYRQKGKKLDLRKYFDARQ